MSISMNESRSDYFATELLHKLDTQPPIDAAYEAQDISREVGFDFATVEATLERALDEVRETREAYGEFIETPSDETRAHFGDEISDLIFSGVNLGRHKKLTPAEFPKLTAVELDDQPVSIESTLEEVAAAMHATAGATERAETVEGVARIFRAAGRLATAYEFDITDLTRENVRKYLTRCAAIEELATKDGKTWQDLADNKEIIAYWKAAKALL